MDEPPVLAEVVSVRGHRIRLTLRQWLHISENHDYMAGSRALVVETIADPDELVAGESGGKEYECGCDHHRQAINPMAFAAPVATGVDGL